jgi:hypothetical protein
MAAVFAFLGMLLLSLVVALLAALQLGDFFRASEEFVLIITVIAIFASAAIAVFAIAYAVAKRIGTINHIALALSLLAVALVALPRLVEEIAERSQNPFTVGRESGFITLELLVPALLIVLVQWGLVRRRWMSMHGGEELSRWPWYATALTLLVTLNPIGLAFLASAVKLSQTDWLRQLTTLVVACGAVVLVVVAAIEFCVRARILRRRLAPQSGRQMSP